MKNCFWTLAPFLAATACDGANDEGAGGDPSAHEQSATHEKASAEMREEGDPEPAVTYEDDIVSRTIAPLFADASQADVMGIRLGMSPEEVRDILRAENYERGRARRVNRYMDGHTFEHLQNVTYVRGGVSEGIRDGFVAYFSIGERPRLQTLYRQTSYFGDDEVPFARMEQALIDKYGAPDSREQGNEREWLVWNARSVDETNCEQSRDSFFALDNARGGGTVRGCFRGLAIELIYDEDEAQRPVGLVRSYLLDSEISRIGEETAENYAREQRERERQEGLENAQPAEL